MSTLELKIIWFSLPALLTVLVLKSGWAGEKGSMLGSADQQNKPMKYESVA